MTAEMEMMGDMEDMEDETFLVHPPAHPVPQLQGPFEESMMESANDMDDRETKLDSHARRTMLLEMPKYERVIAGRWKQKPGERFHPLWKITAQVSFGMHLLAEGMAKSEEEVMKILQSHVDDIDDFLERTTEDFDLSQSDIEERLRYLKLPLDHAEVFDRMLEDRTFRMSIVDGNEKIEHIVERTSEAMKDSMKDVQKGLDATKALKKYLADLDRTWVRATPQHEAVFMAMLGNVEGWSYAFMDLHLQGNKLGKSLVRLSEIVAEMQKRAGIVSRRTIMRPPSGMPAVRHSQQVASARHSQQQNGSRISSRPISKAQGEPPKPLPTAPETFRSARHSARSALPRQSPSTEKHAIVSTSSSTGTTGRRGYSPFPTTPGSSVTARSTPGTPRAQEVRISELAATEVAPSPSMLPKPLQPRTKNFVPVEMSADVPQEILAQAPHSNKSRFSLTFGLKSKDHSEQRSSRILSPSMMKKPTLVQGLAGPDSRLSKEVRISTIAPPSEEAEPPGDYFGLPATPRDSRSTASESRAESLHTPNDGLGIQGISELSSNLAITSSRTSPRHNLAFTSHPPNAALSSKPILPVNGVTPAELPTPPVNAAPIGAETMSHKSQKSKSSLGEPGPEVDEHETFPPQGSNLLDAIAKRSFRSSGMQQLTPGRPTVPTNSNTVTEETSQAAGIPFYAEMEGSSPPVLAPLTFGPAELEAPPRMLRLPPRPDLPETNKSGDEDKPSATIASPGDFFKLPQITENTESHEPVARLLPGHASMPVHGTIEPLSLPQNERSSLPPRFLGSGVTRKDPPLQIKIRPDLLEHISYTPPESPIHARSPSEISSNSARIMVQRPSSALAPPQHCPPPPGPGGRQMVSPDYANAGAFEGERRSKHSSSASGGSWHRRLFSGSTTPLSPAGSRPGSSVVVSRPESALKNSGVDMMTSGGNDVLWFKGMGKDGVWVK